MNSAEAFAAIALAAVACDGSLGRDEAHALRTQLEYRSWYSSSTEADMGICLTVCFTTCGIRVSVASLNKLCRFSARPNSRVPLRWLLT